MSSNIFDTLSDYSDSPDSLDSFIKSKIYSIYELNKNSYGNLKSLKDSMEKFILFKSGIIKGLNFERSYIRAFVLLLFDFSERFTNFGEIALLYGIISEHNISINSRFEAALLFLYPKPNCNTELVAKFDAICTKLQYAIETEEDDSKKAIVTFLNYYDTIIYNTHLSFSKIIKDKFVVALENKTYLFLQEIDSLSKISLDDLDLAHDQIQDLIDSILSTSEPIQLDCCDNYDDFIIEEDTDYAKQLESVPCLFNAIRRISVSNSTGNALIDRGVKILQEESELYDYMKRFGNMHKAKILSAFKDPFPRSFTSRVNLIDWGCGQGLASILFLEKYGCDIVNQITLIEPSELAVKRAVLHCKKYCSSIPIKVICKKIDDVKVESFSLAQSEITIHLFSNILDLDDYSSDHLISLVDKIKTKENYYVCVSPYIDDLKTEKIESFVRYFETNYSSFQLLLEEKNTKSGKYWCCNNTFKNGSVHHGSHRNCKENYSIEGCKNKWTRVIKVFDVSG